MALRMVIIIEKFRSKMSIQRIMREMKRFRLIKHQPGMNSKSEVMTNESILTPSSLMEISN